MVKKLLKKRQLKKVSPRRNARKQIKKGRASYGVLMVLAVVGGLSFSLVYGLQQLSPYDTQLVSGYTCCDSGDGDLCVPNPDVTLEVRLNGTVSEYQLLKSGIKLTEGGGHVAPIPSADVISGVNPGQYVYTNTISEDSKLQDKYVTGSGDKCLVHGSYQPPMDTIFARNIPEGCEAIPNDEIVYVCVTGCEQNPQFGDNAVFNAYFRTSDIPIPGIPETIKNCEKPQEAEVQQSSQRIINLPSPSGKPDLQLETFYIENDQVTANWISPYCKPAVYLYPTEKTPVHVRVKPVGEMLLTIPTYPDEGWKVIAHPNGDIYYNNTRFDYLFYEASIPDTSVTLPKEGYVINYDYLDTFLPELVAKLGLNENETEQFTEYWVNVLPQSPYYQIKIISRSTLGRISPLYIIPSPKTSIRVTLHFTPLEEKVELAEPQIVTPVRDGFTVAEWGGIFKRDAKHDFSCFM